MKAKRQENQRVVTFLNREEVDFLDKLGKDALFSTGLKVSRARIISWLVDFMKGLNINGENIKSRTDFDNRILKILKEKPASHGCLTLRQPAERQLKPGGGNEKD